MVRLSVFLRVAILRLAISPLKVGASLAGFVGRASSKDFTKAFAVISANVGVGRSHVSESGIEPTMVVVSQVYVLWSVW